MKLEHRLFGVLILNDYFYSRIRIKQIPMALEKSTINDLFNNLTESEQLRHVADLLDHVSKYTKIDTRIVSSALKMRSIQIETCPYSVCYYPIEKKIRLNDQPFLDLNPAMDIGDANALVDDINEFILTHWSEGDVVQLRNLIVDNNGIMLFISNDSENPLREHKVFYFSDYIQ